MDLVQVTKCLERIEDRQERLIRLVTRVLTKENIIMASLDVLEARLKDFTAVEEGTEILLVELSRLVREAAPDPARVLALADQIDVMTKRLAAANAANTPGAPVPTTPEAATRALRSARSGG